MKSVSIRANAKINLALAVKFRRADGYHEIESIFQEIDYYDQIDLTPNNELTLKTYSKDIPLDRDNLCLQAAKLMQAKFGLSGVNITLNKHIPVGAGLGGGSSNAAAVIKGILQLFDVQAEQSDLIPLAAQLGSDVPFFLKGGTAYITGRGEEIRPIMMNLDYHIVLVFPGLSISTVWAYKNLNLPLTKNDSGYKLIGFKFRDLSTAQFRTEFYNDFEKTVFAVYPELEEIKRRLYSAGAQYAALSGSGSTLFGVFGSPVDAETARSMLKNDYTCVLSRPISR
jgi:4-diphosphocytidyl-2-C-methyl-D-erythritol kinase